tara:strand:+ start:794 stop:961 length:168 start_codon:yes stop_codon:yes gene_type:complete
VKQSNAESRIAFVDEFSRYIRIHRSVPELGGFHGIIEVLIEIVGVNEILPLWRVE